MTTLALATHQGFRCYALTFRYGQRHAVELEFARRQAEIWQVARHVVTEIDLAMFGGSALTSDLPVPKHRSLYEMDATIPITYVPARNTIFLSFALAWAEVLRAADIFLGVNALDYSGYPDCRSEFIEAFRQVALLGTRRGVEGGALRIHTPLIAWDKSRIIQEGVRLGVDYGLTCSCYDPAPSGTPCGGCDACLLRAKGFQAAGITDPSSTQQDGRT